MSLYVRLLLLPSLLIACTAASGQDAGQPFTLAAEQPTISSGSELRVQITLTNTSNATITVPLVTRPDQSESHYKVEVRNVRGQLAPTTSYGRLLMSGSPEDGIGFAVVKPGESLKEEIVITKLYDITMPGKYVVHISAQFPPASHVLTSNSITISVGG